MVREGRKFRGAPPLKCFFRVSYVTFQGGKKCGDQVDMTFLWRGLAVSDARSFRTFLFLYTATWSGERLAQYKRYEDLKKKKNWINKSYKSAQSGQQYSHTSLCGVALDPRGDGRRSHLIAAGHADVVPRHSLQPGDFVLEWRHCDIDQPRHRHLSFPPTHLFNLALIRQLVMTNMPFSSCALCRYKPHPDVTFRYWWETVVSGAPAQHQLTGLSLCDMNTHDWTGRYCKTPSNLLSTLTWRHLINHWNV